MGQTGTQLCFGLGATGVKSGSLNKGIFESDSTCHRKRRLQIRAMAVPGGEDGGIRVAGKLPRWFSTFGAAAMAGSLFGYDIGSSSSVIRVLGEQGLEGPQLSTVASASLLGALISSIVASQLGNRVGRKLEIQLAFGIYMVGTAIQSLSAGFPMLILGRITYGLGIGTAMHAAPLFISESVPTDKRGSLVALKEAFIVLGILLGYVGGATLSPLGEESWRFMFASAFLFEVPGLLLAAASPETPRFLCLQYFNSGESQALLDKAVDSQASLTNGDKESASKEVQEIVQCLQMDVEAGSSSASLLNTPGAKPALISGVGLVILQQITGQPSVLYYANRIFEQAGLGFAAAVGVGVFKLIATVSSASVVEKYGRKPLLVAGTSIMSVCLAALAVVFLQIEPGAAFTSTQQWGIITFVLLYVGGYQVGFGPVTWLVLSESFPLKVRGQALAMGTVANFGTNLLVAALFEPLRESMGSSALFASFAVISVAAILFEALYLSETKGKTLEEIEELMRSRG